MGHGAIDSALRFQWTFPIVFSPHDADVLYTCSQYLLKSTNEGETWKRISPDLTRNDPATLGPSGGDITHDNTAVEYYATIFTISESPIVPGLIWAGSDDGLVHITMDGGASWKPITPPGMPEWGLCSMIEASPHDPATAWLAVDNHENDDYTPWAFVTHDYGKTWAKITAGIPNTTFFRVIREDPVQKGLLYGGTETGVYVSFNGGHAWQPLQFNLPVTPIHDLVVKEDDVIVATHGRSFWVLDDITPLRQVTDIPADRSAFLFQPKDAWRVRWGGSGRFRGRSSAATSRSIGQNPLSGVVLTYFLKEEAESIHLLITDLDGTVIMTLSSEDRMGISKEAGTHRTSAFLQYPSWRGFEGMIMWAAGPMPITAPPGVYRISMKAEFTDRRRTRTVEQSTTFNWVADPRSGSSDADLRAQFDLAMRISERTNDANDAVFMIRDIKAKVDSAIEASGNDAALTRAGESLKERLSAPEGEIYQVRNRSGQDPLNFPIKLNNKIAALLGVVMSGDYRPTDQSYEVFAMLSEQLQVQLDLFQEIIDTDLASFNRVLTGMGQEAIVPHDRSKEGGG
jgi:hypothetical protein